MKKHQFLVTLFLLIGANIYAQDIQLENGWKKGSEYLYIGLENHLFVQGRIKSINSIRCENALCKIASDTILVYPKVAGPLKIELYTDLNAYSFTYTTLYCDPPSVTINAPNSKGSYLSKNDLDNASLNVADWQPGKNSFYASFELDGFVILIGSNKYYVKGNSFSPKVRTALAKLSSGDSFSVEELFLKNKETGIPLREVMSLKFKII